MNDIAAFILGMLIISAAGVIRLGLREIAEAIKQQKDSK